MDDFLSCYERELTFAREMAAEFARKYPKVAARLLLEPDKCEDPHMERLIEAFAFECAHLHMKIDDDFPEIAEPLLNIVFPHFIRPIPSMSVAEFEPDKTAIPASGYNIGKNTTLYAKPVDGTDCKFATAWPVTIWPVEVASAGLCEPRRLVKDAKQAIVIRLKTLNGLGLDQMGWDTLRFRINGPGLHAFHIHELLFNNACCVEYVARDRQGKTHSVTMPVDHIQPAGFGPGEVMVSSLRNEFPGYLMLFEYFCFPEKFLFFDIKGVGNFRSAGADSVELWIYLDKEAKPDFMVDKDTFSLNCVPIINLFRHVSASINVEQHKTEYSVSPDNDMAATEVYRIDKVIGTTTGLPDIEFRPLYSLRHHHYQDDASGRAFWHIRRRPSGRKNDNGTDVLLSFCDLELKPAHPAVESLVVHYECTNRDLPARLTHVIPSGDLTMEGAAPVNRISFAMKPVPTRRPALGGILQWQAISSLKPNYLPLKRGQEKAFRAILRLYDFDDSPVTRRIIGGIRTIDSQHVTRRIGQAFFRGVEVTIGFEESEYGECGLFMFTSVLERFISQFVSSNSFTQLVVRTLPAGKVFKIWSPRRGERALL